MEIEENLEVVVRRKEREGSRVVGVVGLVLRGGGDRRFDLVLKTQGWVSGKGAMEAIASKQAR